MTAFLTSLGIVLLAEMGDKTQLLAMAFSTRFPWRTVLAGVFGATLVNHFLAVLVGRYLDQILPMEYIRIAASAAFILFGLWTLRGDTLANEHKHFHYTPFWTVVICFFAAEMGDKTQLATVALAARFETVIPVWMGTTVAMVIADAIGIGVGVVLGKKIPEKQIKWVAACVFILFGIFGLYESIP